jgi:hypothetical protein
MKENYMEKDNLFDFELNKDEGYWSITHYYGKDEELVLSASYEGKPVKEILDGFSPDSKKRIKRIIVPEGYISIRWQAFEGCKRLTSIKLPKSLTTLEPDSFRDCSELAEISVDENNPVFCSVDGVLFDKAMTTLMQFPHGKKGVYSVPEGIISIRSGAFDTCKLTGISFPQSLLFIGHFAFFAEQLTDITINELNPKYRSIDGVLFDKERKTLLEYPKNKDKTDYAIPDGIMCIAEIAFNRCKRLVNIVLPESI